MGSQDGMRRIRQQWLEEHRALERQVAEEDAANERRATQTLGRLIADHNRPQDREDLRETRDHALRQWGNRQGVVGPSGQESSNALFRMFNNPGSEAFELNQRWAFQHDMQATDAYRQATQGPLDSTHRNARRFREDAYDFANKKSAIQGMWVLRKTGDMDAALRETQRIFREHGFDVRQRY